MRREPADRGKTVSALRWKMSVFQTIVWALQTNRRLEDSFLERLGDEKLSF